MKKLIFTRNQLENVMVFCIENELDDFFVAKDQGAYIGANTGLGDDFKNCIEYAYGCDPSNENWFETATAICGQGSLGEELQASTFIKILDDPNWNYFNVYVHSDKWHFTTSI